MSDVGPGTELTAGLELGELMERGGSPTVRLYRYP